MVTSKVYETEHSDTQRAAEGDTSLTVDVEFESVVNPATPLSVADFQRGPLATVHWHTAASGIELPEDAASELNKLWAGYVEEIDGPGYSAADEADESKEEFASEDGDFRTVVFQQIKARRGQQRFRDSLRKRYGDHCMISGCALMDVVEAAHIKPYRGDGDNHPANGLLLRADLHTLLDLDLIGVEPRTLVVRLHPDAKEAGYREFDGLKLKCPSLQPNTKALKSKWKSFLKRTRMDEP